MPETREELGLETGRSQITVGTRLIALSAFVALGQLMLWFREGQWSPFDLAEILSWMGTGARMTVSPAFATVVDWLLAIPLSAGIAAIGFAIAWSGASKLVAASAALAAKS